MPDTPSPTSLRIPPDLKASLQRLAEADGRSLTNYIVRVLQEHCAAAEKPRRGRS